ncbi:MAG: 3-hydroxybutyryl-CoA dehydrogenase [Chitinophagia bacterium]|nr:3-hydroxybutyryl-CoA dehydrogenase [Chitinophagia bacterium]
MEINTIGVCGAGTMGRGIALTAALAGFNTRLFDLQPAALENARGQLQKEVNRSIEKGKLTEALAAQALARIDFTNEIDQCVAELFIEAIVEQPAPKIALFNQLAELNHSDCIFASNTSSLSITQMAKAIQHPERVIGLHFFNPATLMKLVEVVTTPFTTPAVQQTAWKLMQAFHKTPVLCIDSPGFIVNRVARPFYIESLRLVEEEKASMAQIDRIMTGAGFKMGPFALMDLIGNDINFAVSCSVYEQLGKPERLRPSALQQQLVQTGKWGQKSGEGYYQYKST